MGALPKVSVVIPFYNCPYVEQAVQSVLDQSYPNVEIIVVDDGSWLHTERLEPFQDRIHYVRKSNGGTASALNEGIRRASGEYFAWLSSDDRFHPDKLRKQVEQLQRTRGRFGHTAFYYVDERGNRISEPVLFPDTGRAGLIRTLMTGCPVNGSTVMIGMEVFRQVGEFNERFVYTHDYELWLRILPHYDWNYIEEPLLDYRVHDRMGSRLHSAEQTAEIAKVQHKHLGALKRLLQKELNQ